VRRDLDAMGAVLDTEERAEENARHQTVSGDLAPVQQLAPENGSADEQITTTNPAAGSQPE